MEITPSKLGTQSNVSPDFVAPASPQPKRSKDNMTSMYYREFKSDLIQDQIRNIKSINPKKLKVISFTTKNATLDEKPIFIIHLSMKGKKLSSFDLIINEEKMFQLCPPFLSGYENEINQHFDHKYIEKPITPGNTHLYLSEFWKGPLTDEQYDLLIKDSSNKQAVSSLLKQLTQESFPKKISIWDRLFHRCLPKVKSFKTKLETGCTP